MDQADVTAGVDGYQVCRECKFDGRVTLTKFPICQRCYNETSADKLTLPHWSDSGEAVN